MYFTAQDVLNNTVLGVPKEQIDKEIARQINKGKESKEDGQAGKEAVRKD